MYGDNQMDPRAAKRFANDRTKAAKSTLLSQSAKSSIPNPSMNRVSSGQRPAPMQQQPQQTSPMSSISSVPGTPMAPMAPPISVEETIDNDLALEKFLSSPEMQQSIARSRLRQYFKRDDPSGVVTDVAADALQNMLQNY